MDKQRLFDRISGSLLLAGMGDALGAPTEQWSIAEIEAKYGGFVEDFDDPPPDTFAGASGGRRGEVTDDASQLYWLARALAASEGEMNNPRWVACLLDWANRCSKAAVLGDHTAAVVAALRTGLDPGQVGRIGDSRRRLASVGIGNGAAVRAAAIGLADPGHLRRVCRQALVVCLPSHDTPVAISAACSVAAAVARALVARTLDEVIAAALAGARLGEWLGRRHGRIVPGPSYVARLRLALDIATRARNDRDFMTQVESVVGNSLLASESVPAAIALVLYAAGDPTRTLRIAASMGNDTDSIATLAGAVVGALRGGRALPMRLLTPFVEANRADFDLASLALALTEVAFPRRRVDAASPTERSRDDPTDEPCRAVCAVHLKRVFDPPGSRSGRDHTCRRCRTGIQPV